MAYYTVWLANGRRFHVLARSSLDAVSLLRGYFKGVKLRIRRVEYIRAVQSIPHYRHWVWHA